MIDVKHVLDAAVTAVVFLLAFTPGFVAVKAYDVFRTAEPRRTAALIFEVLGFSAITYVVTLPILGPLTRALSRCASDCRSAWAIAVPVLLVVPLILGFASFLIERWLEHRGYKPVSGIFTAWDWLFRKANPSGVVVTLLDGTVVSGDFSFPAAASNYPYGNDIFVGQLWTRAADGSFLEPVEGSQGKFIFGREIKTVELVELPRYR
jgi:hypothetical protein